MRDIEMNLHAEAVILIGTAARRARQRDRGLVQNEGGVLARSYSERQFVVVLDDEIVDAARKAEQADRDARTSVNWSKIAEAAAKVLLGNIGGVLSEVTREAMSAWARARANGVQVLQLKKTEALAVTFPPGHPRVGVLYIGHPAAPSVYYTTSAFHRVTFEHKFCEAIDLLMHLGAQRIAVEHVRGWSQEFSSRLSVPLQPTTGISVEGGRTKSSGSQLLFEATLEPSEQPRLPDDLVWYPHESTWQSIAKGRLNFGLKQFSLAVNYDDDFGVNAGLKANVQKAGLEVGGQFEDHESTMWRITGEFGRILGVER